MSERIFHDEPLTTPCWADRESSLVPSGVIECGVYSNTELGLCESHVDEVVPDE